MNAPSAARVGLEIRRATLQDLDWIAGLHARQLPHGFFVQLGSRYLRAYHRSFMVSPYGVALVAERDGARIGFVVGATDATRHRAVLVRRQGPRLAIVAVAAMAARPAIAAHFLRTRLGRYLRSLSRALRSSSGKGVSTRDADSATCAVLTHVAVDPEAERGGVGAALVDAFTAAVDERGAARVELVTLADERGAADFYRRLGWADGDEPAASGFRRFTLDLR